MEAKRVSVRALVVFQILVATNAVAQGVAPTPMIQLRVVDEQGMPIDAGRAAIDSLHRWVMIEKGRATIADLTPGRWTVSLRALGFRPESISVEAALDPAIPVVTMRRMAHNLAPVEVTAVLSNKDSLVLREIDRRLRTAHGSVLTADHLAVRNAKLASDPIAMAVGFQRKSETVVQGRNLCRSWPRSDSLPPGGHRAMPKVVAIYLDGTRLPGGLESANRMVPPSDILAIEAYPDVISAPFLWRTNDACAVIAFWTRRPPKVTVGR
jgi:hypothetical protein